MAWYVVRHKDNFTFYGKLKYVPSGNILECSHTVARVTKNLSAFKMWSLRRHRRRCQDNVTMIVVDAGYGGVWHIKLADGIRLPAFLSAEVALRAPYSLPAECQLHKATQDTELVMMDAQLPCTPCYCKNNEMKTDCTSQTQQYFRGHVPAAEDRGS